MSYNTPQVPLSSETLQRTSYEPGFQGANMTESRNIFTGNQPIVNTLDSNLEPIVPVEQEVVVEKKGIGQKFRNFKNKLFRPFRRNKNRTASPIRDSTMTTNTINTQPPLRVGSGETGSRRNDDIGGGDLQDVDLADYDYYDYDEDYDEIEDLSVRRDLTTGPYGTVVRDTNVVTSTDPVVIRESTIEGCSVFHPSTVIGSQTIPTQNMYQMKEEPLYQMTTSKERIGTTIPQVIEPRTNMMQSGMGIDSGMRETGMMRDAGIMRETGMVRNVDSNLADIENDMDTGSHEGIRRPYSQP